MDKVADPLPAVPFQGQVREVHEQPPAQPGPQVLRHEPGNGELHIRDECLDETQDQEHRAREQNDSENAVHLGEIEPVARAELVEEADHGRDHRDVRRVEVMDDELQGKSAEDVSK